MPNEILKRDEDRITVLGGVTDDSNQFITQLRVDPTTGRLKVSATISGGGIPGSLIAAHFQTDVFSSTNNQTTFVPSKTLIQDNGFYVNGSRQTPSTDYSIVGGNYVLNSGIPSGCAIILEYIY